MVVTSPSAPGWRCGRWASSRLRSCWPPERVDGAGRGLRPAARMAGRDAPDEAALDLFTDAVSSVGRRVVRRHERSPSTPGTGRAIPLRSDVDPWATDDLRVSGSTPRSVAPAPTEPRVRRIARPRRAPHRRAPPDRSGARVLVALGSFLSARTTCCAPQCARATRRTGVWCGSRQHVDRSARHPSPGAVVERHVRQVAWLRHTDVLVTTEGTAASPRPLRRAYRWWSCRSRRPVRGSGRDQRAGLGIALAPNALTADALVAAVDEVMRSGAAERARAVARTIAAHGGPDRAVEAIACHGRSVRSVVGIAGC